MAYKNWKLKKSEIHEHLDEYTQVAQWCNENGYHIEEDESYYKTAPNPLPPEPSREEVIKKQISELEQQITNRNVRGAILGDEFALNKLQTIEAQIEKLRRQLEGL